MSWMNFNTGIATGLVVSLITFLIAKLSPYIRHSLSKEAKLHKDWKWFDSTSDKPIGSMRLKQVGSLIKGELTRNTSTGGEKKERRFLLKGNLYCDKIIALYVEPENSRLGSGAIVLKLRANREFFYGRTLFLQHDSGEVIAPKFIFSTNEKLPDLAKEYLELPNTKSTEHQKNLETTTTSESPPTSEPTKEFK